MLNKPHESTADTCFEAIFFLISILGILGQSSVVVAHRKLNNLKIAKLLSTNSPVSVLLGRLMSDWTAASLQHHRS